jgi:hypothetical protein
MSTVVKNSAVLRADQEPECPRFLNEQACRILAENHYIAKLSAELQELADEVRRNFRVLIRRISKTELKERICKAAQAESALELIDKLADGAIVPPEAWRAVTKSAFKGTETKKTMDDARNILLRSSNGSYYSDPDSINGVFAIVSTPRSAFLALGEDKKGCMGPNVVDPSRQYERIWNVNIIAPSIEQTVETSERTMEMCNSTVLRVLDAFLVLIESVPELDEHAAVFKSLFAIVRNYVESEGLLPRDALALVGIKIRSLCQLFGDASVPRFHSQQLLRISNVASVFHALSESSHTVDEIAAAVTAYLKAQEHYVSVARAEYEGKFVEVAHVLEVARSARRESREDRESQEDSESRKGTKRECSALDEWHAINGAQVQFWDTNRSKMLKSDD